jgi:hypothetical protein
MTIMFPHVIPGTTLAGKVHTYDNINGGMKPLSDFNLKVNEFMGGNCGKMIGLIKEYGFYACPHFLQRKLIAFYIHDPEKLTALGKKMIEQTYPEYRVVYEKVADNIHTVVTEEMMRKKLSLLNEVKDRGLNPTFVDKSTAEELEGYLAAVDSGKSGQAMQQVPNLEVSDEPVTIVHKRAVNSR